MKLQYKSSAQIILYLKMIKCSQILEFYTTSSSAFRAHNDFKPCHWYSHLQFDTIILLVSHSMTSNLACMIRDEQHKNLLSVSNSKYAI